MNADINKKVNKLYNFELRQQNNKLKENIDILINCAKYNEQAQSRLDQMEEYICKAASMYELVDAIISKGKKIFDLASVTISFDEMIKKCFAREYLERHPKFDDTIGYIRFVSKELLNNIFPYGIDPLLRSNIRVLDSEFFFEPDKNKILSTAVVPIYIQSDIVAIISMGSSVKDRFSQEHGLRLIKRYARFIAMKIEVFIYKN